MLSLQSQPNGVLGSSGERAEQPEKKLEAYHGVSCTAGGKAGRTRALHPAKAYWPSEVSSAGRSTLVRLVHRAKAAWPIEVSPAGRVTTVREVQPANVSLSMVLQPCGGKGGGTVANVTVLRVVHSRKAPRARVTTEGGSVRLTSEVHP